MSEGPLLSRQAWCRCLPPSQELNCKTNFGPQLKIGLHESPLLYKAIKLVDFSLLILGSFAHLADAIWLRNRCYFFLFDNPHIKKRGSLWPPLLLIILRLRSGSMTASRQSQISNLKSK